MISDHSAVLADKFVDLVHKLGPEKVGRIVESGCGVQHGVDRRRRGHIAPVDLGLGRFAVLEGQGGLKLDLDNIGFAVLLKRTAYHMWCRRDRGAGCAHGLSERRSLPADAPLKERLLEAEREIVEEACERHRWNMTRAAEALGLERSHLYKKLKALGIERPEE